MELYTQSVTFKPQEMSIKHGDTFLRVFILYILAVDLLLYRSSYLLVLRVTLLF